MRLGGQEDFGERSEGVGKMEFYIVYMYEILSVNIKKKQHCMILKAQTVSP